jgi:hypothetical protein
LGLGVDDARVTVLTYGRNPEFEPVLAMGQCENLAIAVFDSDSKPIKDAVSAIFTTAAETYKKKVKKYRKPVILETSLQGDRSEYRLRINFFLRY